MWQCKSETIFLKCYPVRSMSDYYKLTFNRRIILTHINITIYGQVHFSANFYPSRGTNILICTSYFGSNKVFLIKRTQANAFSRNLD